MTTLPRLASTEWAAVAEGKRRGSSGAHLGLPVDDLHLADTSVWSKANNDNVLTELFDTAVHEGHIAICDVVALELLRSARNHDRYRHQSKLLETLPFCDTTHTEVLRAREVQALLAGKGQHRGVKPADLLIAAAAEAMSVPVLHYDHDYDLIASVTGQPTRWLARRGTLP